MAILSFGGTSVGAVSSANDDGAGGVDLILDQGTDLDGNGNPYYTATDIILIEIDDADIGPNGEFFEGGSDGVATVLSITVNGVELLSSPDKVKFGGGGDTFEGDAYFFVEGIKLFFLAPTYTQTFADATPSSGDLTLNLENRVSDNDFNENSVFDTGTVEVGNGIFNIQTSNVVCFAEGTLIRTQKGEIPVESLNTGDMVTTVDRGPKPIRMIVHRDLRFPGELPELKPIEFKPGSLGGGLPERVLCVSPQHRMLLTNPAADKAFGVGNCLVPAKALVHLRGIRQKIGCRQVRYFHLIFDQHEIVFSEGAMTESMFPGPMAVQSLDEDQQQELSEIFPALQCESNEIAMKTARPCIGAGKAKKCLQSELWANSGSAANGRSSDLTILVG